MTYRTPKWENVLFIRYQGFFSWAEMSREFYDLVLQYGPEVDML